MLPHSNLRGSLLVTRMGIKAVEAFDGTVKLQPDAQELLFGMLSSPKFCSEVAKNCKVSEGLRTQFTQLVFQPVPWSTTTRKGMPQEFEPYHNNPDYVLINVPPTFMFKAKIFNPSRLCAIYEVIGA
eukprot:jgi/Chrzof1/8270/Cz03g03250.t1